MTPEERVETLERRVKMLEEVLEDLKVYRDRFTQLRVHVHGVARSAQALFENEDETQEESLKEQLALDLQQIPVDLLYPTNAKELTDVSPAKKGS